MDLLNIIIHKIAATITAGIVIISGLIIPTTKPPTALIPSISTDITATQSRTRFSDSQIGQNKKDLATFLKQTNIILDSKSQKLTNAQIIKKVKPTVVYVETTKRVGSGFVIDSSGIILTNAHVVRGVDSATIKLSDGGTWSGSVIGRNENVDLALIKINTTNLPVAELGDSDLVAQGDSLYALGYPFGLVGDVSFKDGTLSRRLTQMGTSYLETSVEIHPGNSGGPLVDAFGKVVGVNTATYGTSVDGTAVGETIKLALPINDVKNFIPQLKSGEKIVSAVRPITQSYTEQPKPTPTHLSPAPPATDAIFYSQFQGTYFYNFAGNPPIYLNSKTKIKAIIGNRFLAAGDKGGDSNYIGTADPNSISADEVMLKIMDDANYQKAVLATHPYDLVAAYGYGAPSEYFVNNGIKILVPVINVVRLDVIGGCDPYGCAEASNTSVFP